MIKKIRRIILIVDIVSIVVGIIELFFILNDAGYIDFANLRD